MSADNLSPDTLGQVAFEAYRAAVNNITYDGTPIPEWRDIGEKQKIGWRAAAVEATNHVLRNSDAPLDH